MIIGITPTVFFDGRFWGGIFERIENGELTATHSIFGTDPEDQQIDDFTLHDLCNLRFSPAVDDRKASSMV
ncbi:MAG: DUF2992 family protein [Clostridia bacterium]|nr:DUF2992 family protein [Clostridia bacterium]